VKRTTSTKCLVCSTRITQPTTGRKRSTCSDACRQDLSRQRRFRRALAELDGPTLPSSVRVLQVDVDVSRNAQRSPATRSTSSCHETRRRREPNWWMRDWKASGTAAALSALEAELRAERFDAFLAAVDRGEEVL
jgi:predicted nucleic acid-binding Zn ribbon protein